MFDFCNAIVSEDADERATFWERYHALTPIERTEYDRMVLQDAVGIDHSARFAELSEAARKRVEAQNV